MKPLPFLFLITAFTAQAHAVSCFVDISDGTTDGKKRVTFQLKETEAGRRVNFSVLDGDYSCNLYFSDRRHGTSLACELKLDLGRTFVKSDRSAVKENSQLNKLTFRDSRNRVVDLESNCSS